jgi:hypothetical protein
LLPLRTYCYNSQLGKTSILSGIFRDGKLEISKSDAKKFEQSLATASPVAEKFRALWKSLSEVHAHESDQERRSFMEERASELQRIVGAILEMQWEQVFRKTVEFLAAALEQVDRRTRSDDEQYEEKVRWAYRYLIGFVIRLLLSLPAHF